MQIVEGGLDLPLPRMVRVRQRFPAVAEPDVAAAVARELRRPEVADRVRPGQRIALGVGSRGIARLAEIVGAVVRELKALGADPFIIPAMGSHGGATPAGQREVLATYGVTEEAMGVPIVADMDTVQVGETPGGVPVWFSRPALEADAVLPIGRVKPHTDFHGTVESGLCKMLVIGFGKHRGATRIHQEGFARFHEVIPAAARVVLDRVPVLGGLAIVENAHEEPARIEFVPAGRILAREPELLEEARRLMARLLFDSIDVLVVDELGKDISGAGMDPNVTGRYVAAHMRGGTPAVQKIVVLRLTERTHGNATGLGVADVTTRWVVENIDYQKTWTNVITSTELAGGRTPIWMPSDREAIALAVKTLNGVDIRSPRIVRIRNTLELKEIWLSEPMWLEERHRIDLEALGDPQPLPFTPEGQLRDLPLPKERHGLWPWTDDARREPPWSRGAS